MKKTPSDYQKRAVLTILASPKDEKKLIYSATGSGKTMITADLTSSLLNAGYSTVISTVDSEHLLNQMLTEYEGYTGQKAQYLYAQKSLLDRSQPKKALFVMADTFRERLKNPKYINYFKHYFSGEIALIIDECHVNKYQEIIKHFDGVCFPKANIIGLTATPTAVDNNSHPREVFDKFVQCVDTAFCVSEGFLTPMKLILTDLDVEKSIKKKGKEFDAAMINEKVKINLSAFVDVYKEVNNEFLFDLKALCIDNHLPAIYFCPNNAMVESLANEFNNKGVKADFVYSKMAKELVKTKIERFKKGQTTVMVNCGILSKGFDFAKICIVGICYKTLSRSKLNQNVGRGGRLIESTHNLRTKEERKALIASSDKPFFVCIDYFNNQHEECLGAWDTSYDYEAEFYNRYGNKGAGAGDAPTKKCPQCLALHHAAARICVKNFYDILTGQIKTCNYEFPLPSRKIITDLQWFQANKGKEAGIELVDMIDFYKNQYGAKYPFELYKYVTKVSKKPARAMFLDLAKSDKIALGDACRVFLVNDLRSQIGMNSNRLNAIRVQAKIKEVMKMPVEQVELNYHALRRGFGLAKCTYLLDGE